MARLPSLSGHHVNRRGVTLAGLMALAAALQIAGAVGMAYVAGFDRVRAALGSFHWPWLLAVVGGLAASFVGYRIVYRGVLRVDGGTDLAPKQLRAVVAAGFGGFLTHGGGPLDVYAMQGAGTDEHDANARVTALGGLEHGILAIGGTGAAIAVVVLGLRAPPPDFTLPWVVLPIPGFLVAFWLAERYRDRLRDAGGWRGKLGTFLDAIHLVRAMFLKPRRYGVPLLGMALFWAADALAAWGGLEAFGFAMNVAAFFIGYATGMVFTRRTGPLGGAGVLMVVLPVTIWYSGAPMAVAVLGVFAYRVGALWLPMPFSLAALPTLREIGSQRLPQAQGTAYPPNEPALAKPPADDRAGRSGSAT